MNPYLPDIEQILPLPGKKFLQGVAGGKILRFQVRTIPVCRRQGTSVNRGTRMVRLAPIRTSSPALGWLR